VAAAVRVKRRPRIVRREVCPRCHAETGLTRAELEHQVGTCASCGARLSVKLLTAGSALRASEHVELSLIGAGPPSTRIEEHLGAEPSLTVRAATGALAARSVAAAATLLALFVAIVFLAPRLHPLIVILGVLAVLAMRAVLSRGLSHEQLRIRGDLLEHRSLAGVWTSAPARRLEGVFVDGDGWLCLGDRDGVALRLLDPRLGHDRDARVWIHRWIEERLRRKITATL
jgi:hypothetical protein